MEGPGLGAGDALLILALETSCDETAAALVEGGHIRSNVVSSQADLHARFGGVVPEVASRRHLELVIPVVREALSEADVTLADVETVAVTQGPGLIGALLVGLSAAKALAWGRDLPLAPVNHLHGHVASLYPEPDPLEPPFLCLLASGGHTLLVDVPEHGAFRRLGTTIDDAAGECFDKTAKLLGLGFPGGPAVERAAKGGDISRFKLPRPMWRKPGCDFSFSGLKTAVRLMAESLPKDDPQAIADLCASFQRTVGDVLVDRCSNALALAPSDTLVVAGGVAANTYLRGRLEGLGVRLVAPPIKFCTDNGAMIAWAGIERLRRGMVDALDFAPRPRWPLAAAAGEGT